MQTNKTRELYEATRTPIVNDLKSDDSDEYNQEK